MLIEPNWGNFRAKYSGREESAFEWLCSLLFYKEHNRPTGAMRYFNQPGIEAEPVTLGAEVIGWQAKFIDTDLAKYKAKLVKAIDTAKTQHPSLTQIYFYVNVEFGRSRKRGLKDPPYKTEIEDHAKAKGVSLTWRTASFFETPFVCETNANIAKHFFMLGASVMDFVRDIARHTEAVLAPIHSAIVVEGSPIKIDRGSEIRRLKDTLARAQLVIVSGEGGVGKTAVIKDLYEGLKGTTPFFVFKATEFNVSHINQVFKEYGDFTFSDFVHEHDDFAEKYVVVDSAEKISDFEWPEVFQEFLSTMRSAGWRIIFTTRLSYLEDLKYAFIEIYNAPFEPVNIHPLTERQLFDLAQSHGFSLPQNERLRTILKNPFYLAEYLRIYPKGNGVTSYTEFRDAVWSGQIARSANRKDNIHRKREECFLETALRRAASGRFFVTVEGHDDALRQLESDEIIKFDQNARGYFITHDIYEEWALERSIERAFRNASTRAEFYERIGDGLPIRRAFRGWLTEKLAESDEDAPRLIEATVSDDAIPRHWKDEIIVAVLLSKYCSTFIRYFQTKLLETPIQNQGEDGLPAWAKASRSSRALYEQSLLYRTIFLLRIACKEVDQALLGILEGKTRDQFQLSAVVTQPKGSGWSNVISFLALYKEEVGLFYLHDVLPLLDDWVRYNRKGETTKAAGQLALYYFSELTKDGEFPYSSSNETGEQLIRVILSASGEIKTELSTIFRDVIEQKDVSNRSRYHDLVTTALSSIDRSAVVAEALPKEIIGLAGVFWPYTPPERSYLGSDYRNDIEQYFDLASDDFDYHIASAFQTPMLRLLQVAPLEAVDFIVALTNRSIEYFAKTDLGQREVKEVDVFVTPSERPVKQYLSDRLWMMYRGAQAAPTLLASLHMALERWLLHAAKHASGEVIEAWCLRLVKNARSASITSVVASVVLAESSKLYNIAEILFRTREFFSSDLARMQFDMTVKGIYAIGYDPTGLFQNERLRTCDDKHRSWSLESLAFQYQLFRSESESEGLAQERQKAMWVIFDEYYALLPDAADEKDCDRTWRLCLARMDRRRMTISSEIKDEKVLFTFTPELDPKLQEHSETALARTTESMRYSPLSLWARYRWEGRNSEAAKYPQYDSDTARVIADTKAVYEGLKSEETTDDSFRLFYSSVPPFACAVLVRHLADTLGPNDIIFCRDILLEYASLPLRGNYRYQFGDGLDAAIGALPFLLQSCPDSREDVKGILLLTLFDLNPVGMNTRFSDYAVSAIGELWKTHERDANALFLAYLQLQPKFALLCESIAKEKRAARVYEFGHAEVMQRFVREYESELSDMLGNEIDGGRVPPIEQLDVDALVTGLLLLPLGASQQQHKRFVTDVVAKIAKMRRSRRGRSRDGEEVDFDTRYRFLKKFAQLVLSTDKTDIPAYVQPLIDSFATLDYADKLFGEFISAENALNHYEAFWVVWESFYPSIVELCKNGPRPSGVVHNYLLAWPYWRKGVKEWHSLKERDKGFFARVARDIGTNPAVLYSLAKLLNEIGAAFSLDGIFWISGILERRADLSREDLEEGTVYYLDNLMRGYVLLNREKVRATPELRAAVLIVLSFLVAAGSVTAYLTREHIL